MTIKVEWIDFKREPQCPADPRYPHGKDIRALPDLGAQRTCSVMLPYPAKRCGAYMLRCDVCTLTVAITTAGRRDDPRSVELPCKPVMQ